MPLILDLPPWPMLPSRMTFHVHGNRGRGIWNEFAMFFGFLDLERSANPVEGRFAERHDAQDPSLFTPPGLYAAPQHVDPRPPW